MDNVHKVRANSAAPVCDFADRYAVHRNTSVLGMSGSSTMRSQARAGEGMFQDAFAQKPSLTRSCSCSHPFTGWTSLATLSELPVISVAPSYDANQSSPVISEKY